MYIIKGKNLIMLFMPKIIPFASNVLQTLPYSDIIIEHSNNGSIVS